MKLLTQNQVEDLMVKTGCWRSVARIFAAIAMCEAPVMLNGVSYSNFDAVGDQHLADEKWGFSYGGFQVRSLRAQHGRWAPPERVRDELALTSLSNNAIAARRIKLTQGFDAWSTYTGGQYKAYLPTQFPAAPGTYVVKGGDTLSAIARKVGGFTWQELAIANGIVVPYTIHIGQTLLLPFKKEHGA